MGRRRPGNVAAAAGGSGIEATPGQVAGAAPVLNFRGGREAGKPRGPEAGKRPQPGAR